MVKTKGIGVHLTKILKLLQWNIYLYIYSMRFILLFIVLLTAKQLIGNDTLTRAQIYSFNKGDTFDYRVSHLYDDGDYPYTHTYSYHFSRFVIDTVFYSTDSLTKYIIRKQIFPLSFFTHIDSIILTDLQKCEVIADSEFYVAFCNYSINSLPTYFGQTVNYLRFYDFSNHHDVNIYFANGLGEALYMTDYGGLNKITVDSTLLIYYNGINGTYGTNYTLQPTAEQDVITDTYAIHLFPSPNNGRFTLQVSSPKLLPSELRVYTLQGIEIDQISLKNLDNDLELKGISKGIYIWRISNLQGWTQSGKLIIE